MSKRFAIVSIGTNSTRLLLADVEPALPRIEAARSVGTRIGEGLGERGALADEPMQRTLDALGAYAREIRGHYVRLVAVGTSALRRAENGEQFAQRVQAILNAPLRILSGEEEAAASYRGALTAFGERSGERVGVLDVGGGSTEFAAGVANEPESVDSCEIGAVRLTEAFPELAGEGAAPKDSKVERAREQARAALQPIAAHEKIERLAFVGGSATTTAALVAGKPRARDGAELTRADLQRVLERLLPMPLAERKKLVGMRAQRADILPGGIVVLQTAMDLLGLDRAAVSGNDLLLGILLQERDASARRPSGHERLAASRTHRESH